MIAKDPYTFYIIGVRKFDLQSRRNRLAVARGA